MDRHLTFKKHKREKTKTIVIRQRELHSEYEIPVLLKNEENETFTFLISTKRHDQATFRTVI